MKVGVVLAVVATAIAAGCTAGTANPHLLSPKLVVHARDDGGVTLYVHSAFGEHVYDRLALSVDNASIEAREDRYSIETKVATPGFFVEVEAGLEDESYRLRARVDVDAKEEQARLVVLADGQWGSVESYALPYERIIERVVP